MSPVETVHIIDDDEAVRDSLATLLEIRDIPVATYSSGQTFLDRAAHAQGCVVTDVQMPGMGGLELLRALKDLKSVLPVIVMSGRMGRAMADQAMALGAAALVDKPFTPDTFVDMVRTTLATAKPA